MKNSRAIIDKSELIERRVNGRLIKINEEGHLAIFEADQAVEISEHPYHRAILELKDKSKNFTDPGERVDAAVFWIKKDHLELAMSFDMGWWRGGAAELCSIVFESD